MTVRFTDFVPRTADRSLTLTVTKTSAANTVTVARAVEEDVLVDLVGVDTHVVRRLVVILLLVAGLLAWRGRAAKGMGALISSKVNQWTLLVGTLPIVFSIAAGGLHGLPIDAHQREELLLTAGDGYLLDPAADVTHADVTTAET